MNSSLPFPIGTDVAYFPEAWSVFLSTITQASAALAGLVFVAISINLAKIVAEPLLIPRAAKALVTLVGLMLTTGLCLVPGQSHEILGVELFLLGIVAWLLIGLHQSVAIKDNPYLKGGQKFVSTFLGHMSAAPVAVCGASLAIGKGGGLYWLVGAVGFSVVSSLLDAWVLLVEILR